MNPLTEHVSFSQLNMFLRCGEQYRRRYVQGEIISPSASLIRGKGCHKSMEKNWTQKVETRKDLPVEAISDYFSDYWDIHRYLIAWNEDDLQDESPKKAAARFKDSGIQLLQVFHQEQAPNCQPVTVEDEFTVEFKDSYPPLIGIIDRIDEGDIIAEEKFVSKSPSKDDVLTDIQLTNYDLGFRQKYKRKPKKLKKQWAVNTKIPKTVIQEAEPRDDETITRYLFRLQSFMDALQKGIFLPATNSSWWCSDKWCGYWKTCKFKP